MVKPGFHYGILSLNSRYILLLLFLFGKIASTLAVSGKYPIQTFTPDDYKAGIQNIDFSQNRDMNLFVANNLGVLNYNGYEWQVHASKTGKKQRSLAFDEKHNRLYYGSQGDFGYFIDDWSQVSLLEQIPPDYRDFDEVWDVFINNSTIYFCTFEGIYLYDGQSIRVVTHPNDFNRSFLSGGKVFTQTKKGEHYEIKDGVLIPYLHDRLQQEETLAGIVAEDEGYLMFYNSGRIDLVTSYGTRNEYDRLSQAILGTYINHVLELSDARLVISTQTAGLFIFDRRHRILENITTEDGLLSNACLRTFQDFDGNLWVGMQNGLALVDITSPMRFLNQNIDIQGSGYEAYNAPEGTYYTTSNGIYYLPALSDRSIFLPGTEGPAYGMQKIASKLYAGHHSGLFNLQNGVAKKIASTQGLWQIKALKSRPGYAIGGTYTGLFLFKLDNKQELTPVQAIEGFEESSRFFEEDPAGRLWVSQFYKGLYRLELSADLKKAQPYKISREQGLPNDEQLILSNIDNDLYLATPQGIFKIDTDSGQIAKDQDFSNSIGNQQIYLFTQDNQKNIHIYSDSQVGFFKQISSNNYLLVPSSLFQLRYFFNNDLLHVSINAGDGVLFNANEGFIQYRPELETNPMVNKIPVIGKVLNIAEDQVLYSLHSFAPEAPDSIELVVSHRAKVIQIQVEVFQFKGVNNQQFRYHLHGFDEDYGDWTNSPTKEYTNLTEGKYTFTAQSKNHLGQIVSSKPVFLQVKPPFHRSQMAKVILLTLVLLGIVASLRIQRTRYQRKARDLEQKKQMELARKQQQLIEIEDQQRRKLQALEEDKMKSELEHINNLLAASTMNLVVKNEFMESIKEELKEVRRKGKSPETKKALEKIVKSIDTTLKLQEDWKQFEFHFDQVHGDFLNRLRSQFIELTPNEQKLCALLRLNLNTKEISNLMGISHRGVEIARYRLRKKLDLHQGQNLAKFILEY